MLGLPKVPVLSTLVLLLGKKTVVENLHLDTANSMRSGGNGIGCFGTDVTVRNITAAPKMKYVVHLKNKVEWNVAANTYVPVSGASGLVVENCKIDVVSDYFVYSDPLTSNLTIRNNIVKDSIHEHITRNNASNVLIEKNDFANPPGPENNYTVKSAIIQHEGKDITVRYNKFRSGQITIGPLMQDDGVKEYNFQSKRVANFNFHNNELIGFRQFKINMGVENFNISNNIIDINNYVFSITAYDQRYSGRPKSTGILSGNITQAPVGKTFVVGDTSGIKYKAYEVDADNFLNGKPVP
jgi:hypothetical protein